MNKNTNKMQHMNHIGGNKAYWEALCRSWDIEPAQKITYTVVKTKYGTAAYAEKGSPILEDLEIITEIDDLTETQRYCTEYNTNRKQQ